MKFDVALACNVPAYGTAEVEAASQEEANQLVAKDIETNGWESQYWQQTHAVKPDWSQAEDFRVL